MQAFAYIELLKLKMVAMVLITICFGYLMGLSFSGMPMQWVPLLLTLLGAALSSGGSLVLNQYLEYPSDKLMNRTKNRPIPTQKIAPEHALIYGTVLTLGGVLILSYVNLLSAFLTLLIAFLYVLIYTPLKKLSWINTPIGAISGAIPPLIGWSSATGHLSAPAWILFAILFLWQHPHFYAIAWIYQDDYKKGGYAMLPLLSKKRTIRHIYVTMAILIPVSVTPSILGITGHFYAIIAIMLGIMMGRYALNLGQKKTIHYAQQLLTASLVYLPTLFLVFFIDTFI